ncbi:zinc finger CCCH domain-containing protein 18 isoform X2 [Jatropha curcas]|uniref:zinc finger CCCH domain-containing protein 18 isoform X2 n=1 Tax=Jatropha curcas TaxID=180498 RepID=UPI0005FADE06|nr:zinc finger CCCH domain-containing protein 18 isoform X2 [Jatropha curcas]
MDFSDGTRILHNRISKMEPENVTKIIGYLLIHGGGEQEMFNLAMSPDVVIQEIIYKAKAELNQFPLKKANSPLSPSLNSPPVSELPSQYTPFSPVSSRSAFLSPAAFRSPSSYWDSPAKHNSDFVSMGYMDSASEIQGQTQFLSLDDQIEPVNLGNSGFPSDYFYSDAALSNLSARAGRRYSSLNDFPVKTCHYFNKGFCKHGSNCRYFHGQVSESFPRSFDSINDDQVFSPGSLEKLELEIIELLKSRKGNPVSIASLPMIYYEKYGKVLQAEGYLTESQRHGKAGYSLTKLLARLKNSIRLIDRPHGQHAVILAEDVPKYMENRGDRNDPGPIVSGSRQIYLTFPAESTFTEDDVSNYFNTFGPVEDVRIPCQQKRMFGFVTFESADTVKMILAKGNPHFVCGARVLVKPYREKSKLVDRKYQERIEHPLFFSSQYLDMDAELHSMPRGYETSRLLRKQLLEEQEQALELERRRLAELRIPPKPMTNQSYFGYSMNGLKFSEDNFNLPSTERFSYLLDVLNSGSASDDRFRHTETNYADQDSQGLNLPESPFASPIASGISTVI